MTANNNVKPSAQKSLPFENCEMTSEHDYAAVSLPMEMSATANNNKRDRGLGTPADTPEKAHTEKKSKGMSKDEKNTESILNAIEALGQRVNERMEDVTTQLKQHSAMLTSIAKSVQLNAKELDECKTKIKHLEKTVETLKKENEVMKNQVANNDRYKRRWCLRIKGKKENAGENVRAEVIQLLSKIAPDLAKKMDEAVDVVHRVGRVLENKKRQIIILFARRAVRDEIWKRTKTSPVCKEEGIRFAEDLTQEDWKARQALWPKIEKARKEGKAAGFKGPFGFIEGKRITE